ncbi:hypothetical protein BH24DEI2_BH24DEI2_01310 [soil metagenome]
MATMKRRPPDLTKMLRFQQWQEGWVRPNHDLWDFMNFHGNLDLAVAFSSLFWPDIVEVDGCYFRSQTGLQEMLQEWNVVLKGDKRALEGLINHLHVYDLFSFADDGVEIDLSVRECLGETLVECWTCALKTKFPEVSFTVDYATEPDEYGPTLTFYQTKEL